MPDEATEMAAGRSDGWFVAWIGRDLAKPLSEGIAKYFVLVSGSSGGR